MSTRAAADAETSDGDPGDHVAAPRRRDAVVVPRSTRLALVRFPGYVSNIARVERALGGRRALTRACFPREALKRERRVHAGVDGTPGAESAVVGVGGERHGRLELNLQFDASGRASSSASRVYGERRETRSIVLKLTKRRRRGGGRNVGECGDGGVSEVSVEALGLARRAFLFRGAADFQRRQIDGNGNDDGDDDDAKKKKLKKNASGSNGGDVVNDVFALKPVRGPANDPFMLGEEAESVMHGAMGSMSLRPPLYTRDDVPVTDYFALQDTGAKTTREVDFHEIAVPSRGIELEMSRECRRTLEALSAEKDAWAPLAALAKSPKPLADEIAAKKLYATTFYQFSNGPFKRLWIKVGVDPRQDRSFVRTQTVTVRLPSEWFRPGAAENKKRESLSSNSKTDRDYHAAIHAFRALPDVRHPTLVIGEVGLRSVQSIVEGVASSSVGPFVCDERRGWLPSGAHRKVQRAVLRAFEALMNGEDPIAADTAAMDVNEPTEADDAMDDDVMDDDMDDADADADADVIAPRASRGALPAGANPDVYDILGVDDDDTDDEDVDPYDDDDH